MRRTLQDQKVASIRQSLSALRQLGLQPLVLYAAYRLKLHLGLLRVTGSEWRLPGNMLPALEANLARLVPLPGDDRREVLLTAADLQRLNQEVSELLGGKIHLFDGRIYGAEAVELPLNPVSPLVPWVKYETGKVKMPSEDPKFTWEPGRFGWAYLLGRSYHLTGDERCPQAFWRFTENFLDANPPYLGPHWVSAQEVALRLIAFCWALRVFNLSEHTTSGRKTRLIESIVSHAARIPPTLVYARSQNNNHLLTEAAGLYTAGLLLDGIHPQAAKWCRLGWKWFHRGIKDQVAMDGSYSQHSTNYHRLMLQTALWVHALASRNGEEFPKESLIRLVAATCWLDDLLDPQSGRVPNLGPNDGAYILPLTSLPFNDFRPVVEAARRAFITEEDVAIGESPHPAPIALAPLLPGGEGVSLHDPGSVSIDAARPAPEGEAIEEMSLWYGLTAIARPSDSGLSSSAPGLQSLVIRPDPRVSRAPVNSWAYLRAVRFNSRPGHADQLHMDLWWKGMNIAQDAGTYRYTAPAPWDNALTHSAVHNTVTVDGLEQMRRAGRFLYLDWAQAEIITREKTQDGSMERLVARHNGYRHLGITHQREVRAYPGEHWSVFDLLDGENRDGISHIFRLHWLLPDWEWKVAANTVYLQSPSGIINLEVHSFHGEEQVPNQLILVRAGKRIYGASDPPYADILGWVSPTYSVRLPALSLVVAMTCLLPARFTTEWVFP